MDDEDLKIELRTKINPSQTKLKEVSDLMIEALSFEHLSRDDRSTFLQISQDLIKLLDRLDYEDRHNEARDYEWKAADAKPFIPEKRSWLKHSR